MKNRKRFLWNFTCIAIDIAKLDPVYATKVHIGLNKRLKAINISCTNLTYGLNQIYEGYHEIYEVIFC